MLYMLVHGLKYILVHYFAHLKHLECTTEGAGYLDTSWGSAQQCSSAEEHKCTAVVCTKLQYTAILCTKVKK